jgi:hypothetical protein
MKLSAACLAFPLLAASFLAACDTETGANGLVLFTPQDCGNAPSCDLDNGVAVGGSLWIELDGAEGVDIDGVTMISSDPGVFDVIGYRPGTWPEFEILGIGAGYADMIVIDRHGVEMDYSEIEVSNTSEIDIVSTDGDAIGPFVESGYDQVWEVNAGRLVAFDVLSQDGFGTSLVGEIDWLVEIDEILLASMDSDADVARGRLRFRIATGEYPVSFYSPSGTALRALIRAR